ncbi:hypothetical protein C8R46DRAFT_1270845 [Mycena filopes]|nr:hypothetical protein C8R46DRAFT_1270845 [Mycena filopes]
MPSPSSSPYSVHPATSAVVNRLLSTNDAPLPGEMLILRDLIAAHRAQISRLPLESATAEFPGDLDGMEDELRRYVAILSPLRRIPAEILCEIFTWRMLHDANLRYPGSDAAPPWYLGHICRRWRDIARTYGPLWSSITLYMRGPYDGTREGSSEAIKAQIGLTHTSPLHVTIHKSFNTAPIGLLLRRCARWRGLRVQYAAPVTILHLRSARGNLATLRSLQLMSMRHELYEHGPQKQNDNFEDTFAVAPQLRQVLLTDAGYNDDSAPVTTLNIPWAQITHFRAGYPVLHEALGVFAVAVNLVQCGIRVHPAPIHEDPARRFVLSALRRLYIDAPRELLAAITTPALQELWLYRDAGATLLDCIQRSECRLTTLVIFRCSDPDSVIRVLTAAPTLATLFVAFDGTADPAAQSRLIEALTNPILCPQLARLAVGHPHPLAIDAILDVADSRRAPRLAFLRIFTRERWMVRFTPSSFIGYHVPDSPSQLRGFTYFDPPELSDAVRPHNVLHSRYLCGAVRAPGFDASRPN